MRILNVKDAAVTRGVLDKDVEHTPDLIEITFMDNTGVPHTIFTHRDGPFTDPQAAIDAWEQGTLHPHAEEQPPPETPLPPQGRAETFSVNPPL